MPASDPDFFDLAYYRLLAPFHTEAGARRETAAIRELLGLAQGDRILDLGCGWGRHTTLLAGAGHDVVGLDLSLPLLRRVRRRTGPDDHPGRAGTPLRLVAGDMLRLPLADERFDVVLNLATSLGLFLDDAPATRALAEARRVLRPGGRLLLEGMHREEVEPAYARRDGWMLEDGTEVRVRRRLDPTGVSHEVLRWEGPQGSGEKRHSLRLRTGEEVLTLLRAAGLAVLASYGDWTGEPFQASSPRLIAVAGRT
ncbi:MAG: class I SAM-dependent methyltransferase [Longimicrobiales bacterium]|nr:class I SAM-dependent methyltransferase [Longimicrobiales bacterium]